MSSCRAVTNAVSGPATPSYRATHTNTPSPTVRVGSPGRFRVLRSGRDVLSLPLADCRVGYRFSWAMNR